MAVGAAALGAPAAYADATRSSQWYLASLGITTAWDVTKGKGVTIGIADGGVDGSALDLKGVVVKGKDFSGTGVADGGPVHGEAHGTGVASLAAGRGHGNGAGVIGAAPQAGVVSASLSLGSGSASGAAAAVRWLADQGVGVINLSFVSQEDPAPLKAAIGYAQGKDVVVVAATGDLATGVGAVGAPANFPGVVAVTGIDKNLKRDPGATVGPGTALAAPFSTTATTPFSSKPYTGLTVAGLSTGGQPYSRQIGTSLSAPIVSGIVALIRAKFPKENAATVITRLLKSATPAGGAVPNPTYGYGIVNAAKALSIDVADTDTNPLGSSAPVQAPSSASSSTASTSDSTSTAPTPSTAIPSSDPTGSAMAASTSDDSSGPGAATIGGIAAAVVVVIALAWLIARNRRTR